jgi:hypothetical protein
MTLLSRRRERRVADARIASPEEHTVIDASGAVRSIQAADVTMPEDQLEAIWSPMHLERLARTYWKYLSRVSLGLIRVRYTATERSVVFVGRPFVMLRFDAPEYEMTGTRGVVRWRIRDGLLVARKNQGHLEIDVRKVPVEEPGFARIHVEVEVASFYPAIATFLTRWFYSQTQSRIHVLVTHGFLRSLARLDLEQSAIGRFAAYGPELPVTMLGSTNGSPHAAAAAEEALQPVTVGDTPWRVIAALAVVSLATGAALALMIRARLQELWERRAAPFDQ